MNAATRLTFLLRFSDEAADRSLVTGSPATVDTFVKPRRAGLSRA